MPKKRIVQFFLAVLLPAVLAGGCGESSGSTEADQRPGEAAPANSNERTVMRQGMNEPPASGEGRRTVRFAIPTIT